MEKLVVKKSKFEKALVKIEEAAKENQKILELSQFKEKGGLFELFSKKVTGAEMNSFSSQIQNNLIALHEKTNKFYIQFTEIYNAFELLDKEYITGIVGAFNQAIEATKKAEDAQNDVNSTVRMLEKMVEKHDEFNKKVSFEFSRLDSDNWRENALKYQKELEELDRSAKEIIQTINMYKEQHNELTRQLEDYKREKIKNTRSLKFCWITTGIASVVILILIVFIIFRLGQ